MPELPDIRVYQTAMQQTLVGQELKKIRLGSPFLLRSVHPSLESVFGKEVIAISRLGKRLVLELEADVFVVVHLMIAGRFHWKKPSAPLPRKTGLAMFDFQHGSLYLSEASTKKRASLHLVAGRASLTQHDPGGLDLFTATSTDFKQRLTQTNNTLKRALTDPRRFDGIGNAYSDEILHHAKLSPLQLTQQLKDAEISRLYQSCVSVLKHWITKLSEEAGKGFPKKVTAFHPDMAVHGKFRSPCPNCSTPIQRIVKGEREVNYCPACQTGGKLLADRAWSKLLKKDWPRTVEQWEALHNQEHS